MDTYIRLYNLAMWNVNYLTGKLDEALRLRHNDEASEIAKDLRQWQESVVDLRKILGI